MPPRRTRPEHASAESGAAGDAAAGLRHQSWAAGGRAPPDGGHRGGEGGVALRHEGRARRTDLGALCPWTAHGRSWEVSLWMSFGSTQLGPQTPLCQTNDFHHSSPIEGAALCHGNFFEV